MKKLFFSSLITIGILYAQTPNTLQTPTTTDNQKNSVERGWRFGDFKDLNTTTKKTKKSAEDLLAEILKVQKEQLKVQKKMLAILQEQFDPKPKEITVNGKKCIANSSADCFSFPLVSEAKRIPVMANWLKNPTIENAAKYQAWLSKYMSQVMDIGMSNVMAITQFGDKYYKHNFIKNGFLDGFGKNATMKEKTDEYILKHFLSKKIQIFIFLGMDSEIDSLSINSLTEFYNKFNKDIEIAVIYRSKEVQQKLKNIFSSIPKDKYKNIAGLLNVSKNVFYGEKLFNHFGIYATPAIVVKNIETNKAQIVEVGKTTVKRIVIKIINYAKFNKLLPLNYMSNHKQFNIDTNNNYSNKQLHNRWKYKLNFKGNTYNYIGKKGTLNDNN